MEQLHRGKVTHADGVEEWVLAIDVDIIHWEALVDKDLYQLQLAVSGCVEKWSLFEIVFLEPIDTHFHYQSEHLDCLFFVRDAYSSEGQVLAELAAVCHVSGLSVVAHKLLSEFISVTGFAGFDNYLTDV